MSGISVDQSTDCSGDEKRVQYGTVLLVPSTTFDNGNAKITVLKCNKLN